MTIRAVEAEDDSHYRVGDHPLDLSWEICNHVMVNIAYYSRDSR